VETIIGALIGGIVSLVVCVLNNRSQQKETDAKQTEFINLITYRLEQLEKKVDLHNNAVERLYEVEKKLGIDEEKIKVANRRIGDLEKGAHGKE
jgi:hypothetical protein